jgi:hypothetical protein
MADRPDWCGQVLIKGQYLSTLVPVGVDANGNLLALMQGDFGGVLKTIQVDANGIMKANLAAQDLNYLKVRPTYGQIIKLTDSRTLASAAGFTDIFSITGKGAVLGGWAAFTAGFAANAQYYKITVDGAIVENAGPDILYTDNLIHDPSFPLSALFYDPASLTFGVQIGNPIPFETSFLFSTHQDSGGIKAFSAWVYYALVP